MARFKNIKELRAVFGDDLRDAYLRGVSLRGADLRGADLRFSDLRFSDLRCVDLQNADLQNVNLRGASLWGANFRDADLQDTVLDPGALIPDLADQEIEDAGLVLDTVEDRPVVRGWRTRESQHCGSALYVPGVYEAPYFSVCKQTPCHPGIYLAGKDWLKEKDYEDLIPCWCYRDELIHAGDKWRTKRLFV